MAENEEKPVGLLGRRLHLYDTVRPPRPDAALFGSGGRGGVNAAVGEKMTGRTYIYQMRKGPADNPTYKVVLGLSEQSREAIRQMIENVRMLEGKR